MHTSNYLSWDDLVETDFRLELASIEESCSVRFRMRVQTRLVSFLDPDMLRKCLPGLILMTFLNPQQLFFIFQPQQRIGI